MKKRTVYLVYRPVLGHEDSMQPYLVFSGECEATECVEKMNAFHERMRERIEKLNVFEDGIADEEYVKRYDKRDGMLARARWPFGISLADDIHESQSVVAYMPIPAMGTF